MAVKSLIATARPAARFMYHTYRVATNSIRILPDFIIIGAQKGGTTSLYNYLIQHPNIHRASTKEVGFFDYNFQRGSSWYRTQFPTSIYKYYVEHIQKQDFLTGEASPNYFLHPHAPKRAAEILPRVKLIVLLRNPVDRAYSQYRHNLRHGFEKLSFEDAIARDEERLRGETEKIATNEHYYSFNFHVYAYHLRGIYADQLQAWFNYFPREQILVLKSEDFYADSPAITKQTLEFLNLPDLESKRLKEGYKQYHKSGDTPSKMGIELRQRLVAFYEPHNARLYELLGRDFAWS